MKPILILGLGNPLQGDDGAGCAAAQSLLQQALPDTVEVQEAGTPGVGLVNLLEGRERVILVDAAQMNRVPGEIVQFSPAQVELAPGPQSFSLHDAGVAQALALARALEIKLPEITILAVQIARPPEWGTGLSPEVEASVPRLVQAVLDQVGVYNGK